MKTVAQTVIGADHFYTIAAHTGNVIQAVEGIKGGASILCASAKTIRCPAAGAVFSHLIQREALSWHRTSSISSNTKK